MKKIAIVVVPILAILMMVPFLAALMVTAIASPAAGQELKAIACTGSIPASGSWRPPFQQGYARTSGYGMRFHPISGKWKLHTGQDLVSHPGPGPVVAATSGKVVSAEAMAGYGNAVVLEHPGSIRTLYAHLASIDGRIVPGAAATTGQILGVEGSTGASTGDHLHFEVTVGSKPVDPAQFMMERGAPLNGKPVAASPPPGTAAPTPGVEGGIGFPLPHPGLPRSASRTNPLPGKPRSSDWGEHMKPTGFERMWTADELAEFAGVSVSTLYHWRWQGKGPKAIKVGRFLRYPESDIEKWLEVLGREVA